MLEGNRRTQQRRHKQCHELSKDVTKRHQRDESQRMKPALILSIGMNAAFERLQICQKIAMRQNHTARLSCSAGGKKDLRDVISRDGLVGKAFINSLFRPTASRQDR